MSWPDAADLQRVTDAVNALPYVSDPARYRSPEFWARIDAEGGDCEDFALGKLNRLSELGWPGSFLRLACCYVEPAVPPPGNYHAVLVVRLPAGGERVLDNRWNHPCTLDELARIGYRPDVIQSSGGSLDWVQWLWRA